MASTLRRMVVLGPSGTILPGGSQDYREAGNRRFFQETGTRWARLWADWPTLMPTASGFDTARLDALDEQIALARRDGLRIILTLYRFPTWANGIDGMTADQLAATMPDRRTAGQGDNQAKLVEFRYPDDVSAGSPWGRFVDALVGRYSRTDAGRPTLDATIDVLEVCNEPNLQWWPQQSPSTTGDPFASSAAGIVVHDVVARMFETAQGIVAAHGGEPLLAGPGLADFLDTSRLRTGYASFAGRLLPLLASRGFRPGPGFAWTHHNYTDVTFDQGAGTTAPDAATVPARTTNNAADMRRRLVGNWAGWPAGDASDPWVMITEGGVTMASLASAARWNIADPAARLAKQAELIRRNWDRMATDTGDGAGIAMVCNYLWYTDPNFDSGLCDDLASGGATRPAYATWSGLPSFA
ncbi:MAG: hypothetical protein QOD73_2095 [Solirubrobacteraceae bacterium]|nr:hypothetical protein [Solirubrobacteraceae bacterium]